VNRFIPRLRCGLRKCTTEELARQVGKFSFADRLNSFDCLNECLNEKQSSVVLSLARKVSGQSEPEALASGFSLVHPMLAHSAHSELGTTDRVLPSKYES